MAKTNTKKPTASKAKNAKSTVKKTVSAKAAPVKLAKDKVKSKEKPKKTPLATNKGKEKAKKVAVSAKVSKPEKKAIVKAQVVKSKKSQSSTAKTAAVIKSAPPVKSSKTEDKLAAKSKPFPVKKEESVKSPSKKDLKKKPKGAEALDDGDDFIDDDVVGNSSEIEEYAEELEEVEALEEAQEEDEGDVSLETEVKDSEEVALTDAEGRKFCRYKDCDQIGLVDGYCRLHYLLLWKKIQNRKKILQDGKLERYVDELTARYPDKFLELIKKDLRSEKDFLSAIQELEIDDSGSDNDFEEEAESFIDEVRGISDAPSVDDDEF